MKIEISEQTLKLALHALTLVTPSGGGSPAATACRELAALTSEGMDYELLQKMAGSVISEMSERLEEHPAVQFSLKTGAELTGAVFCHPYDMK